MKFGLILATDFSAPTLNSLAPVGLGCLEAIIKQKLPSVEVIFKENPEDLIAAKPDVIGISSTTEYYHLAIQWASELKRKLEIPIIIGGIHISLLPESMTEDFDVAIIGEGDYTIIDFLESFIANKGLDFDHLKKIPGLYFKHEGKYIQTPQRSLIQNLDILPPINWKNLPYYKWHQAHIVASRGCPYKCSFCASEKFSQKYRYYSAPTIVKEIEYFVVEKKLGGITFFDDLLIANKKRLAELIKILEEKKLLGKCRFHCQVRANLVDEETCLLLKKLNIATLGIGIETFSNKILSYYNKTGITSKTNQDAIDMLSSHGFKVNPSIIFGAPIETKEDMLTTLRAIYLNFKEGKLTSPSWTLLRPYPGTAIWQYAEKKGIVNSKMDWTKFTNWGEYALYLCENVSQTEFEELISEWQTKISLLVFNNLNKFGGNFILSNKKEIITNALRLKKIITERIQKGEPTEIGDDIILTPPVLRNKSIVPLAGWHQEENNNYWINKRAETLLLSKDKKQLIIKAYIPPTILEETYKGELDIVLSLNGEKILYRKYTNLDFSDGHIWLKCDIKCKKSPSFLEIITNKSFIPNNIDKENPDIRELALIISNITLQ